MNSQKIKKMMRGDYTEKVYINDGFGYSSDEDEKEKKPHSKVWEYPNSDLPRTALEMGPKEFVRLTNMDDIEYDFRQTTAKGRRSRRNLGWYLLSVF